MNNKNNSSNNAINFRDFFKVIAKRKISFTITFIIIFAIGLLYSFLVAPQYSSISEMEISKDHIYYNEDLYKYFPKEADNLWIIPDKDVLDYIVSKIDPISADVRSGDFLGKILAKINISIDKEKLFKYLDFYVDRAMGTLTITVYTKNPELSYTINKTVLDELIDFKKNEREKAYKALSRKIDIRISELKNELEKLPSDKEKNFELTVLSNTKDVLLKDKDLFINRIEVIRRPEMFDVRDSSNYFRNILLSLFASLIAGTITAFIVNYFKSYK